MNFWLFIHFQKSNLLILIFFILTLSFVVQNIFNSLYPSVISLTDISKCPACYGRAACKDIFDNDKFKIKPFDIYSALSHLFFSKNVFYGIMGETRIVVKKLAHDDELETFDEMLCESIEFRPLCWRNKNYSANKFDRHNSIDYNLQMRNAVSMDSLNTHNNGLILCPTTKHLERIIDESLIDHFDDLANLWTVININPEPIILMMLSAEDGWPVPKFYGACGRIIVESYEGLPLTLYYDEPWLRRARIAIDLLEAARLMTFGSAKYGYYLTDISSDNIAVDDNDKPKFIDLEDIIIVDKNVSTMDQPEDWYDLHVSDNAIGCENCFVFSPMDICGHQISDHNYYAICQHILQLESSISKGFLHSVPKDIFDNYSELEMMLNECAMPEIESSRIVAADKLQRILTKIVEEVTQ